MKNVWMKVCVCVCGGEGEDGEVYSLALQFALSVIG